ncbi:hypothetical protein CGP82_00575 [Campylobacter sp. LR185c]|nr:hypothetical protein CGP82_00575 [Campylobacter sp. LR185c]
MKAIFIVLHTGIQNSNSVFFKIHKKIINNAMLNFFFATYKIIDFIRFTNTKLAFRNFQK